MKRKKERDLPTWHPHRPSRPAHIPDTHTPQTIHVPVKDLRPFKLQRMSSPVRFRQVQNSLHQVQDMSHASLRIEISFKVLVHDRFRSNFLSSAQVRKPKSNQETCYPQFTTATTKLSIISQCVQSTTNNRNS